MRNYSFILRRIFCLFIILGQLVTLAGCLKTLPSEDQGEIKIVPISKQYFDFFDTVSIIISYAGDSEESINENCDMVVALMREYHKLFDIYHTYSGINNLATLNANAGGEPLIVDQKLIDFLLYTKEIYTLTNGETNVMLGSVLKLWHDARSFATDNPSLAKLPDAHELKEASLHTNINLLEIDDENNTVRISDPNARIDVGALGKGYATEKAANLLEDKNVTSYVLNIGGNIRIIGNKPDGTDWVTGIKNPFYGSSAEEMNQYAFYTRLSDTSCVTSGDYERYFKVDGVKYHHIIDQDTLLPAEYFSSVTVITKNSGLADALSTALFCMPYESGLALVNSIGDVDVLWIAKDGTQYRTDSLIPTEYK